MQICATSLRWRRVIFSSPWLGVLLLLFAAVLGSPRPAAAEIGKIETFSYNWPFPPGAETSDELRRVIPQGLRNAAKTDDLVNIGQPTLASIAGSTVGEKLHNGIITEENQISVDFGYNVAPDTQTIFHLNTALHPQGYDINRIWLMFGNKITGDRRHYALAYSQVGSPDFNIAGFQLAGDLNNTWALANWGTDEWLEGAYDPQTFAFVPNGEPIWSNVDAVAFYWFDAAPPNNYGIKVWEIDIEGVPTPVLPEHNPDLVYDPTTGNVRIFADGASVGSFNLQSAGLFNPVADFSGLAADTGYPSGPTDNTPIAIGWVGGGSLFGTGFDGPLGSINTPYADLGNIFPTGLDYDGLSALLTNKAWGAPIGGGPGGDFDLFVQPIPEPCSLLLAAWGLAGLALCGWRRRTVRS